MNGGQQSLIVFIADHHMGNRCRIFDFENIKNLQINNIKIVNKVSAPPNLSCGALGVAVGVFVGIGVFVGEGRSVDVEVTAGVSVGESTRSKVFSQPVSKNSTSAKNTDIKLLIRFILPPKLLTIWKCLSA